LERGHASPRAKPFPSAAPAAVKETCTGEPSCVRVGGRRHVFCQECIKQAVKAQKKCPTCRKPIMLRHLHRIYLT